MPRVLFLATLALLGLSGWVLGADAPATPLARAAEVRAALPKPVLADGFAITTDIVLSDQRVGTATYLARPFDGKDGLGWEVVESSEFPEKEEGIVRRHRTRAVLGRDLRLHSYDRTVGRGFAVVNEVEHTRASWDAEGRLAVVRKKENEPETTSTPAAERTASATLSALILFLRRVPVAEAVYELPMFVYEAGEVRPVRIEVAPSDAKTLRGTVAMTPWTLTIDLATADRTPLRIEQVNGKTRVAFVIRRPASTPTEAGQRFLVGILTGDGALVAGSFHWPTLLETEKAASGFSGDEAELRERLLVRLAATFGSVPRPEAERQAEAASDGAFTKEEGGRVKVEFSGGAPRLAYWAKQVDGAWYVVELLGGK